jgi:type IV pilus assembly protein PilN
MIRINLLAAERDKTKKQAVTLGTAGQKLTVGCSLILVLAVLFIGWRYWALSRDSSALDAEIAAAQQETTRLHSVIQQVQQFEQRKAQLQQRVVLIEQLRKGQTGPVHMLDQISRALPQMLWLTELKQTPTGTDVVIDGKCTTLTGLSEFVSNLEASGYFKRSIEIVDTKTEMAGTGGELIKFTFARSSSARQVAAGSTTRDSIGQCRTWSSGRERRVPARRVLVVTPIRLSNSDEYQPHEVAMVWADRSVRGARGRRLRRFYYYYEMPVQKELLSRRNQPQGCEPTSTGQTTARSCLSSSRRWS